MSHHPGVVNGNGTLAKLVFWILGVVGTVFLAAVCFFGSRYVNKMELQVDTTRNGLHDVRDRLRDLESDVRRLREELKQVQDEQRNMKRMIQAKP